MKKFCSILLCLLILPLMLVGCNKANTTADDGFVEVQSIEYTTPNSSQLTRLNSRFYIDYDVEYIDAMEYENATLFYSDYKYNKYFNSTTIDSDKSNLVYLSDEEIGVGNYYYVQFSNTGNYAKFKILEFKVIIIKVKVISDTHIEIIDGEERYLLQTEYFKVNYFKG